MKSLFNPSDCNEMISRINKLTPQTSGQWGKMNVGQMMTHLCRGFQSATGELKLKRSLLGILMGRIAKKKILSDKPWGHNMPTDKGFVIVDQRNFDEEKMALIGLLQRFATAGPNSVSKDPHPFFGPMTAEEWDKLMLNHLNHHLSQFGV